MTGMLDLMVGRMVDVAVARARVESPRASELLQGLANRSLLIHAEGTPWSARLSAVGQELRVARASAHPGADQQADAVISGTSVSLLALAGSDPQAVIRRGDVRIEGDAQVADGFRELLALLRPDLEASLGKLFGRSGAHWLVRGIRGAGARLREAVDTSVRNVSEYLAHESGDLVSRAESAHYLSGVDSLREQADRVAARTELLRQRLDQLQPPEREPA